MNGAKLSWLCYALVWLFPMLWALYNSLRDYGFTVQYGYVSFGGFTLDKGTADGVAVNDAVISDRGYLLGMVVEADPTSCKVMTILHPSFSAAGVVSRTRENGIINGSTDYAGDGLCVLTNLERATETKMGDQVITTGLGGVFPPDLLVGTVQKVEPEVSGKSSIAVVRPGADPRTVKHVFVITDY